MQIEMDKSGTIILSREGGVASISLNRPEVRNAMNLQMIREIRDTLAMLNSDGTTRVIIFTSGEETFCAGADIKWMQSGMELGREQLLKESLELAGLFRAIRESAAVTVSVVRGHVPGGAVGLLAASDFVVAEHSVVITFPELSLGLIPSTIAPHVLRKAGIGRTSDWMMTGRHIDAAEAREAGLIHRVCEEGSLEACTKKLVDELLSKGVQALKTLKKFLGELEGLTDPDEVDRYSSRIIADLRISPEGQEGMRAFFEKRRADWDEGK